MWNNNEKRFEEENEKLRHLLKECREVIENLVKQNQELKQMLTKQQPVPDRTEQKLNASVALRFKVRRVNTTENKFGAMTHGTKEINILQQWYSVSGSEYDENGEWRDVRMEGSLY
jgi:predicted RNase H-like nuclease (RuvC/YqgF family)